MSKIKKRKENVNNASILSFWGTEEQKKKKRTKTISDFWNKKDDNINDAVENKKHDSIDTVENDIVTDETEEVSWKDEDRSEKEDVETSKLPQSKDIENKNDKQSEAMLYSTITSTFETIESISSRLEIQNHLTNLYRSSLEHTPSNMYTLLYLTSNTVAPAYECIELGVGDAILLKALSEASGTNLSLVKSRYEKEGDLGKVAMILKGRQKTLGFGVKPKPLVASEVLEVLRQIAKTSGAQSQKWKVDKIKGLLVRASSQEAKYIMRALQGRLRIGLSESTVLISLGHALFHQQDDVDIEEAVQIIKKAYAEVPSYTLLLDTALTSPLSALPTLCTLQPGLPVSPMLAKPTKSILEVLKRLNKLKFTCEYKYDGERAQVHLKEDGTTAVFSRNLLDTTEKYSEVPGYVKEASTNVSSFVLDTEVVAFNRETQQFVPFQILSTRKKKLDEEEIKEEPKVQIIVQAFDLMYVNNQSLLNKPLSYRRELLHKYFKPIEGKFAFATYIDHMEDGDTTQIEEFLEKAVKGQCEGLMIKTLDVNATYEPSKRSLNWLKLKKDYLEGLGDSVDLVVLGAYHGRGKRTGVYGAYLLACYDVESEEYQSVCKIGTGFSEEDLKSLAKSLNEHIIPMKSSQYLTSDALECDVWFDAVQVWEVKAADLSKSSSHKGAFGKCGEAGRGIGLRFPRFERVREDKKPEEATSSDQILEMYYAQESVAGGGIEDYDEL